MRVSEIRVKQIRVNQGLGVYECSIFGQCAPRRPKNEEAADNRKTRLLRPRQCHLSTQIL